MKSFFVPTYLKLGKLSEEKLLVGLIAVTPQSVQVKYSAKRIQLCAQVVSPEYAMLAKEILEQIQNKASEVNALLDKSDEIHFENIHVFNADYFEYLKNYSQNTIVFGNVEVFGANQPSSFLSLYENLMNEKPELIKTIKSNFHTKIKSNLKASGIEDKADIEFKIGPDQLAGLYNDMTVSLITKNGSIFAVEAIDFNNGIPALTHSLNAFEVLIGSLNQFSKQRKFKTAGTYSILNSIPKSGSEQEKLLNHIFKVKKDLYKVMPEESIEEITNKIKSGNYQKFSSLL